MPRLRSGLETGEPSESMASLLGETFLPSPAKNSVDAEMESLETEFKIYNEKAASTSQMYLNLLIKSYQDQIATLKEELKEKNNVIFDILYATSSTITRGQTYINHSNTTMSEETQTLPQANSAISKSSKKEANKSVKWFYPKNGVNVKAEEYKTIETSNRFSSLADNEWVKDDNESVFEANECAPSSSKSKQGLNSRRRPDVVVEKNPELNTIAPYRKPSVDKGKRDGKRTVAILGDSMIRNINYRDISKSCPKEKIYVKAYPGADVSDMRHYSMPTAKRNPNTIFIHCGTNSLQTHDTPESLAQEIIDLATSLKNDDNEVIISSIICRSDEQCEKVQPVNEVLYARCLELPFGFMDNDNIKPQHLSTRGRFPGLHLNDDGNDILFSNFVNFINM